MEKNPNSSEESGSASPYFALHYLLSFLIDSTTYLNEVCSCVSLFGLALFLWQELPSFFFSIRQILVDTKV